jgi:2-methylcitrate dehydratase PrpD
MKTVSTAIADWIAGLDPVHIPPEVTTAAKLRVLDIVGAMLGGRESELAEQTARAVFVPENGSGSPVIGFAGQTGVGSAAMLQGTLGCVLEFDDSHVASGIHASTPVVAATVAKARQQRAPGTALIQAVLLGNELACRLGLVAPGMFHRVGFHPTAVIAGFGATYGIAHLLRLDAGQMVSAAGLAGSFASGIMASWEDGSAAKSLHAGWAAAASIQAAGLAQAGVSGPVTVYEGRFGFFRSHVQAPDYAFNFDAAVAGLGSHWESLTIAPRAYPCGHYSQPFIDAALAIVRAHRIDAARIRGVECAVADYMIPLICEPLAEKISPATPWHARYSLPFCIAECILRGRFDKHSLGPADLQDPRYVALTRKFRYTTDRSAGDRTRWSGDVTIVLESGERLNHRVDDMRGTPRNPFSMQELVDKFLHNATGVLRPEDAEQAVERILQLETAEDLDLVFQPLSISTQGSPTRPERIQ